MAIGRYPTFIACAVRQAAIEVSRSSRRARPPETAVNAAGMPGSQLITSKMTSGRSTLGSIDAVRLRRSTRDGASSTAFTPLRWILPSSSMPAASLAFRRPPTSR